jgi:hypothetical protein
LPGNLAVDLSTARLASLKAQVNTALEPVLRPHDFASFDLDRAFSTVAEVAAALGRTP